jgi:D-3-phosphoglycerate dehydrogenase
MTSRKIVLVTDYAWPNLKPEHQILAEIGAELLVAESGSVEELVQLAPRADAILFNWKPIPARVLGAAKKCVGLCRYGIGLDNLDVATATSLGMVVANVPAYCVDDVADYAMALLLACTRKVAWFDRDIKSGRYDLKMQAPLRRLAGHTLGLVGFGRIGRAVALRAVAFGIRVIALQPRKPTEHACTKDVKFVSFSELMSRSDYLSIHLPATPETVGLFNKDTFDRMKDGVVLINTARGSLVRTEDLLQALESGKVAAAGIDVWQEEPLKRNDPLANHRRVIATPHAAFYSDEALVELQTTAASQIVEILSGKIPQNVVNREVLQQSNLRVSFESKGN